MTTVVADLIQPININAFLDVIRPVHNDPNDPTKQIELNLSQLIPNLFTVFIQGTGQVQNIITTLPDRSYTALISDSDQAFTVSQTCNSVKSIAPAPNVIQPLGSNIIVEPASGTFINGILGYGVKSPLSGSQHSLSFLPFGQVKTNFITTTPSNLTATITLPEATSTVLDNTFSSVANTYTAPQKFQNGIRTQSMAPFSPVGNLTLTPNGTGSVIAPNSIKTNILKAFPNVNCVLSGNGLGTVNFGANGIKFANEVLTKYNQGLFTVTFSIGALSFVNTVRHQINGKSVTLRFTAVTQTPAVDGVWTSTAIPTEFRPLTAQIACVSIGVRNGTSRLPLFIKINTNGTLVVSLSNGNTGFGTSGACGWPHGWSVTYNIN